jgi:hypothetical protein
LVLSELTSSLTGLLLVVSFSILWRLGLVYSLDMSFTFLMEMEDIFIQESFVTKAAKQRVFRLYDLALNPRDEFFPAIERF